MAINKSNSKLSSNVLKMKFMKKSKEKSEREAEEEKRKCFFDSEMPVESRIKGGDTCIMEPSFVPCLKLINGRLSFKGMNPEIEKLMQEESLKDVEKLKRMDGISNNEMAERYSTLVGTMQKNFSTKRKRAANAAKDGGNVDKDLYIEEASSSRQRPKFLKPTDH